MDKRPLIVVSLCAVVLLVLGSLSNVVGYQTVQTSQQNLIKDRINQRELLFQTIVDIANNKEIQRIILKSQMSRGIFPPSEIPVITKNQLKQMHFIGLILSKIISKSRMQSIVKQHQFNNQEMQKEITIITNYLKYVNNAILNIKIIIGFLMAIIMMMSAVISIPIFWTIFLLLKLGILPKLEGFLEIVVLIFIGIAYFCWVFIPDEFWDWFYNLFPSKSSLLMNRGNTCIPLE